MPYLELISNVKIADPKAFILEFSKLAATTLGKPEAYITCSYTHNETLTFGGTLAPAFGLTVTSLDNLSPEANEKYSKTFSAFFAEKLGAGDDRGYITFIDPGRAYIGFKGTTFQTIFGGKN